MLEIRRFLPGDAAAVWRLHNLGLNQMGVNAGPGPWDDDLSSIAETYLESGEFLIGVLDGEIVCLLSAGGPSSAIDARIDAWIKEDQGDGIGMLQDVDVEAVPQTNYHTQGSCYSHYPVFTLSVRIFFPRASRFADFQNAPGLRVSAICAAWVDGVMLALPWRNQSPQWLTSKPAS